MSCLQQKFHQLAHGPRKAEVTLLDKNAAADFGSFSSSFAPYMHSKVRFALFGDLGPSRDFHSPKQHFQPKCSIRAARILSSPDNLRTVRYRVPAIIDPVAMAM